VSRRCLRFLVRRPALAALLALAVLAALVPGLGALEIKTGYRGLFHADDPLLRDIETMNRRYRSGDGLLIMLKARDGDVLDRGGLTALNTLTERLAALPETRAIASLSTRQRIMRTAIGPMPADLVPKRLPRDDTGIAAIRRLILSGPEADLLVTPTGDATLIRAEVTPLDQDGRALARFMQSVEALIRDAEAGDPDLTFALGGLVALNNAFVDAAESDLRRLFPAMLALLCLGLLLFTRSLRGVLGPLIVVIAAVLAALGAAGWLAIPVTPILSIAPTIILGIGIADSLHILVAADRARLAGRRAAPALYRALRGNLVPVALTTLTTGAGFLALLFSKSPPFRDLGLVTAIGVATALFFTFTLLPAINLAAPGKIRSRHDRMGARIGGVVDALHRRRVLAPALTMLLIVIAGSGLATLRSDDRLSEWFDDSVAFRRNLNSIHAAFGSTERASWVVPLPNGAESLDIRLLEQLDAFSDWLTAQPEVTDTVTLATALSEATGTGAPDRNLATLKRLLRTEKGRERISALLAGDLGETRIVVTLTNGSTRALLDLAARARSWTRERAGPISAAGPSGPAWSLAMLIDSSARAMLNGTVVAFLVIAALLGLLLRSWRLGLVGLTAMVVPPALVYGIWSWTGRSVGLAESVVAATALGLQVDACIHILTRYRTPALRALDKTLRVRRAFEDSGPALVTGFIILIAGFAVLTASPFRGNMHFGLLTAATLATGILVALLVLPLGAVNPRR
jgi:predicted RND superfamily exporter protein